MPFHGFRNFRECLRKIQQRHGKSREDAAKICGALRAKEESIALYDPSTLSYEELLQDRDSLSTIKTLQAWPIEEIDLLEKKLNSELRNRGITF